MAIVTATSPPRLAAPGDPSANDAARDAKRQVHRVRMTLIAMGSTALQSGIILLFATTGAVAWPIAVAFPLVGLVLTGSFVLLFVAGWNTRLRDPDMVAPQMTAVSGLQLTFLVLAPNLWVLFLVAVLVTYNFAMISFNRRQFVLARVLLAITIGLSLLLGRGRFGHIGTSDTDLILVWLFFILSIHQLTLIGTRFSSLRAQLSAKNEQLSQSLATIRELASIDELTGVANRRSFMEALVDERARALRERQGFCVAILDIDRFKSVNDRYGHFVGDDVLKEFCAVVQTRLRVTDRFARFGGEEFALLMTGDPALADAERAVDRIRSAIAEHDWSGIAPDLTVTTSAGVARWEQLETVEAVLGRADTALYAAKDSGRNQTATA
ncbi:MAG: diguanylate cyclase [Actinotalea sp.]|nr:diguanylate cyclase [Actinotalea sp.]